MHLGEVINQIKRSTHIIISAHTNPDGDAIGAMVSMGHFLKSQNIDYTILLEEKIPKFDYLLDGVKTAYEINEPFDSVIALDCGNTARLMGYENYFRKAKYTIGIDHHVTNDFYATYNYVKSDASSTSEIVYKLIKAANVSLTEEMAIALYTGILTDTGGFMHGCTTPETLRIAAELISFGFDFSKLYHELIHEKSLNTIRLQGIVTTHLKKIKEGIYLSYLSSEEMAEIGATKEDTDSLVSFLKSIKGVQCIGFIYPINSTRYKLSTRCNPPYDVASFCAQLGGGGHVLAAGATVEGEFLDVVGRVESLLFQIEKC